MAQVVQTLTILLASSMAYSETKAHNMLVIILDLCFKNTTVIKNFVG